MLHFRNLGDPNVAATPKALVAAAAVAVLAAAIATVIEAMWAQWPFVAPVGDLALPDVVAVVVGMTAANRRCSKPTNRAMPLAASISTVAGDCNCCCRYYCYYWPIDS